MAIKCGSVSPWNMLECKVKGCHHSCAGCFWPDVLPDFSPMKYFKNSNSCIAELELQKKSFYQTFLNAFLFLSTWLRQMDLLDQSRNSIGVDKKKKNRFDHLEVQQICMRKYVYFKEKWENRTFVFHKVFFFFGRLSEKIC